jgi:hypothetical protein
MAKQFAFGFFVAGPIALVTMWLLFTCASAFDDLAFEQIRARNIAQRQSFPEN